MSNKMLIVWALIIFVAIWLYNDYAKNFAAIKDTKAPLPINQYTNGVANGNTNDVLTRKNFRQQPVGLNLS